MTITLTLWQLVVFVVVPACLIGFTIGAAAVLGLLMHDGDLAPVRVRLTPPLPPTLPLSTFPGWDVVTHNELDQFARHYQGTTR